MKGAHADFTRSKTFVDPLAGFEAPHVLVAADTTIASSTIAAALRDAGYDVTACPYDDVVSHLRTHKSVELLVLDGTATPWVASGLLEAVRAVEWTLPIILVAGQNPDLRTEAQRLGVEVVLDAPLELAGLRRAADGIVPAEAHPRRRSGRTGGPSPSGDGAPNRASFMATDKN